MMMAMMDSPMLPKQCLETFARSVMQVTGVGFSYPQAEVFSNLSFNIPAGVTLVRGGDGRGKTTLLRLLADDLTPQAGQISPGIWPNTSDVERPQVFWIDPRSTAHHSINARGYLDNQAKRWPGFDRQKLAAVIKGLSLAEFLDKPLYMLSTGSKRKVWLAAAFASNACVALLDDPFAALDKPSIRYVIGLLQGIASDAAHAVVISGYGAPDNLCLAGLIDLGD